jgi:hypothetical protein
VGRAAHRRLCQRLPWFRPARPSSPASSPAREQAHAAGLVVNAGHGINYVNIAEVRTIPHLHELNIGHSIISRALFTGIDEAVREMKARTPLLPPFSPVKSPHEF